jgi:multiple sugar transport system permease protein
MRGHSRRRSELGLSYAFLAPALILLAALLGYPILDTLYLSLTRYNSVYDTAPTFIGLDNYLALLHNSEFLESLANTLAFTAMFLPLFIGGSLLAAVAVTAVPRLDSLFRTPIFLPVIVGESVAGVVFSWIFSKDFGLLNQFLSAIGLGVWGQSWLSEPRFALPAVVVVQLWLLLGVGMLIFIVGLRSIPGDIYEAAAIDGASPAQAFWRITLPNLRIHLVIATVWGLVQAIKIFGVPYVMTHGGPAGATETLYFFVWSAAFKAFDMGLASAAGYVVAFLILVFSGVAFIFRRSAGED